MYIHTWRVLNLRNTLITSAFAEQDSGSGSMGKNVTADWLTSVCTSKESTGSGIALDLVGQENGQVELWSFSISV
jgi:hypothetical protein